MHARRIRIAYVLKRFPVVSQTFVASEMIEVRRGGVDLRVLSLVAAPVYICAVLPRTFALVSGLLGVLESMGLVIAEAQCAGAAAVSTGRSVKNDLLCQQAAIAYEPDDPGSLAAAVAAAQQRDPALIPAQAAERFGYDAVVRRTRAAIGL